MKKLFILLVCLVALSACTAQIATLAPTLTTEPTATPAPTILPTATNTPEPTTTPLPPIPTATEGPTSTPNPNAIAKDFLYYFRDNYRFYASKMTPKVEVELIKFGFEHDNESNLNLILETKSGEVVIQEGTPLIYSITMLASDLEKDQKLPEGIKEVLFTFRNNDLEIREQAILDWEVLLDYVENDITLDQLVAAIRTLP